MDVAEALAREAIRDVIARYNQAGDHGRIGLLARCFAPWGVLAIDGEPPLRGREAIVDFLSRVRAERSAASPRGPMRHHVSSTCIAVEGTGHARATSYYLVVGERGPDHSGSYRDRFVRTGKCWWIAHRAVGVDWVDPGSPVLERARRMIAHARAQAQTQTQRGAAPSD